MSSAQRRATPVPQHLPNCCRRVPLDLFYGLWFKVSAGLACAVAAGGIFTGCGAPLRYDDDALFMDIMVDAGFGSGLTAELAERRGTHLPCKRIRYVCGTPL